MKTSGIAAMGTILRPVMSTHRIHREHCCVVAREQRLIGSTFMAKVSGLRPAKLLPQTAFKHHQPRTQQRNRMCITSSFNGGNGGPPDLSKKTLTSTEITYISAAALTTAVIVVAAIYGQEEVQDFLYDDGLGAYREGFSFGDFTGSGLWAVSLYYASPLQLLLLFLGRIDTNRPSDTVLRALGKAAGNDVDALSYEAPTSIKAATVAIFLVSGVAVTCALDWAFGETTWAVSTGLVSCISAAVYELGRPMRLSTDEAQELEEQWQEFAAWADMRLDRSGRCHFTEIEGAFRTEPGNGRYRTQEGISEAKIRNMIANWAPSATRTPSGFYKGVSLKPRDTGFGNQLGN
mmetsp:Transcript_38144/g.73157  ORF Transcript_38144/g.73157 Transcript_38144/m.73157 type:complete len:348 (-) Transcript_38144:450-1493(-)|eukprot:CAMPEP_0114229044 /NCGR_PEP_ID=MMETSP0058-20121206/2683_1 /TAXON_ID=36894 /ORGANISM="Pyramimonas parkeae, CCMP726" /LENGTH=347 /DNA_ID=CAMNT_0001340065 /DNA_START=99 /DNA_END=1142 /DNA_ORIENTATION=-